jgi:6-phosphogluconolactonase/glucosamine-6-phosphate isomerase/deaminase
LTVPAINAARLKVLLVCGEDKAAVLKKLVREPDLQPPLPAQFIEDLLIVADRPAAAGLPPA